MNDVDEKEEEEKKKKKKKQPTRHQPIDTPIPLAHHVCFPSLRSLCV